MKLDIIVFISLALLGPVSAGCNKTASLENGSQEITFSVQLAEGTKAAGAAGQFTATDLSSLDQFKVTGYDGTTKTIDARTVYKTSKSGVWQFIDNPKAWIAGHTMTFWADANMPSWASASSSSSSAASLAISSIPAAATDQWDPLIGYYSGIGTNGKAIITFYHPLTAITFKTGTIEDATISGIESVKLTGVYQSGEATVSKGSSTLEYSWSTTGTTSVNGAFSGTQSTKPFILIPQTLSSAASIAIEATATLTAGGTKKFKATLTSGEWKSGVHYTYSLGFSPADPMDENLTVTLKNWEYVPRYIDARFDD